MLTARNLIAKFAQKKQPIFWLIYFSFLIYIIKLPIPL